MTTPEAIGQLTETSALRRVLGRITVLWVESYEQQASDELALEMDLGDSPTFVELRRGLAEAAAAVLSELHSPDERITAVGAEEARKYLDGRTDKAAINDAALRRQDAERAATT